MDNEMLRDQRFQRFVVDFIIPFPEMLKRAGYEGYSYDGKCFCPFHDNFNTPAAKIFKDKRGDTLFCFTEQRTYRPSDVILRGLFPNGNLYKIFNGIWKQLDESRRSSIVDVYGSPVDYIPQKWKDNKDKIDLFKSGDISFSTYLEIVRKCLD